MNILCTARFQYSFSIQNKTVQHRDDDKKQDAQAKEKANTRSHNTITEMMYCTEGKKRSYMCVRTKRRKKKKKKVAEKEKNLAQTD
jgi:hypothetical protein